MFNKQNWITTLTAAGMTTALSLGVFWSTGLIAKDKPAGVTPKIAQPTLNACGGKFNLTTDKANYATDESPVLTFTATNPTDKPIRDTITVAIQSISPSARLSRRITLPKLLWTHPQSVVLKAGETKTFTLKPGIKLPAKQIVTLSMQSKFEHDKLVQASRLVPKRLAQVKTK
jgi:hypothetical protein